MNQTRIRQLLHSTWKISTWRKAWLWYWSPGQFSSFLSSSSSKSSVSLSLSTRSGINRLLAPTRCEVDMVLSTKKSSTKKQRLSSECTSESWSVSDIERLVTMKSSVLMLTWRTKINAGFVYSSLRKTKNWWKSPCASTSFIFTALRNGLLTSRSAPSAKATSLSFQKKIYWAVQ